MGRKCYLCNNKYENPSKKISLHRFPQNNRHVYQRWLEFCGLKEEDDVSHIYICTNHFCSENIKFDVKTKRFNLIYEAIPSIKTIQNSTVIKKDIDQDDVCNSVTLANTNPAILVNTIDDVIEQSAIQNNTDSEDKQDTPPKARFVEPRYVSEIQSTDVGTPRRTRRTLLLVKTTDERKSKEIKRLKDKNRKLKNRIVSMQQVMMNLYQKGIISKKAGKTLMVNKFKPDSTITVRNKMLTIFP